MLCSPVTRNTTQGMDALPKKSLEPEGISSWKDETLSGLVFPLNFYKIGHHRVQMRCRPPRSPWTAILPGCQVDRGYRGVVDTIMRRMKSCGLSMTSSGMRRVAVTVRVILHHVFMRGNISISDVLLFTIRLIGR